MKKQKNKKVVKNNSKNYFTKVHEKAIIRYVNTTDPRKRNELYITYIQPAFEEMVDKIVYRYKFTSLPNIGFLIQECKSHLITVLSKFDKSKGFKAFSYFSVITKNWFMHKAKKLSLQIRKEAQYEELSKTVEMEYMSIENPYFNERTSKEFLDALWKEILIWESLNLKPNEKKVLEAIKILLSNADSIDIFNKKAVYLFVREITNLNTKQILNNFNKFRTLYRDFIKKWNSDIL